MNFVSNKNKLIFLFPFYRISDQSVIPSVTRSVSVSDTGSIWELQPTASQPTGKNLDWFLEHSSKDLDSDTFVVHFLKSVLVF